MLRIVATRGRRVYRQDARAQIRGGRIGKPAIRACAARKRGIEPAATGNFNGKRLWGRATVFDERSAVKRSEVAMRLTSILLAGNVVLSPAVSHGGRPAQGRHRQLDAKLGPYVRQRNEGRGPCTE
jgi:hypothetical protein